MEVVFEILLGKSCTIHIVDMCHGDRRGRKKERIRRQRKLRTGRRKKIEKGNEDGR